MNVGIDKYAELIEEGLQSLCKTGTAAIVITEQEEADVDKNPDDYMHAYSFLNGKHVDLCIEANTKKGYVKIFDINEKRVKTSFGNVEVLRWGLISHKSWYK